MKSRLSSLAPLLLVFCAATASPSAPETSERIPYAFSNFPWWSDAELRSELRQRIPSLPDELPRSTPFEAKIRESLIALLQTKGVSAQILVSEPDADEAKHIRAPGAPPASIVFRVLSPEILVGQVTIDGAPSEALSGIQQSSDRLRGRPYSRLQFWSEAADLKQPLNIRGYLTASVDLEAGAPVPVQNSFAVPLRAHVSPGPQYHVSHISASGGPLLPDRDLSPYFTLHAGDVAWPNPFGRIVGSLRSLYWEAGYADVQFSGEPVLDPEKALASYALKVEPGPVYHVRSLSIMNLKPEEEGIVRSALSMRPGDIYNEMAMVKLSQVLRGASSPLPGRSFSYKPIEDKVNHLVDLTLVFYKNS